MSYCKNTTENNHWCKPLDEIDNFLATRAQFFINVRTYVQEGIFPGDSRIDRYPYNGDTENYFPTTFTMESIYKAIEVDNTEDVFQIEDIHAQYNTITLEDDPLDL